MHAFFILSGPLTFPKASFRIIEQNCVSELPYLESNGRRLSFFQPQMWKIRKKTSREGIVVSNEQDLPQILSAFNIIFLICVLYFLFHLCRELRKDCYAIALRFYFLSDTFRVEFYSISLLYFQEIKLHQKWMYVTIQIWLFFLSL